VKVAATGLLLVALVITTGSSLAMLLALRHSAPHVSWKLRLRLLGVFVAFLLLLIWSRRAYLLVLLLICAGLLIGTMVLALVQVRRSRRI
jgi:hypothetical protein